ncbi:MAG: DUF642 domain-containing protein [Verrucomicrobiota bacterium]|nr:DUF642 domain-containing protein [Verrucomicrobiota bacterium]
MNRIPHPHSASIGRFAAGLLIVAQAIALATANAQQPAIVNGSFEDPPLGSAQFGAGAGTGWTTVGSAFRINNNAGFGTTPFGTQFVAINPAASISQTVAGFIAGQTYLLSFALANGFSDPDPTLRLTLAGVAAATTTFTVPVGSGPYGSAPIPFVNEQFRFTAGSSGSVTFTFSNASTGGASLGIDNVSLATIPEPGSGLLLLGISLAALGVTRRLVPRSTIDELNRAAV